MNEGYTELTGQAFPPPVALHADGHRIDLRFYDLQTRMNLPAAAFRDAAAAVRAFGRRAARWIGRRVAASREADGLGWPGRLRRSR